MRESLTPVDVEAKLRQAVTDLTQAQSDLRGARDAETDAELAYQSAHRRTLLSPECPPVRRDGHTAAERDAWVTQQVEDEYATFRRAEARRKAAEDHLRTVREIASTVQSLGAMVRSAYQMAGTTE